MLSSEWCALRAEMAEAVGDMAKAKAYRELEEMWRKRENEKAKSSLCVCGKSPTGSCIGLCATGE